MPSSLAAFWTVYGGLTDAEKQVWERHVQLTPVGHLALLGAVDPFGQAAAVDARLVWRYRHDPPEMCTLFDCGDDRWHAGLWFDSADSEPLGIVSTHAADADPLALFSGTALQLALHRLGEAQTVDEETNEWLFHLREWILEHSDDVPPQEQVRQRIETGHGVGVLAPGDRTSDVESTRQRIVAGAEAVRPVVEAADTPAECLALGQDLLWWSGADAEVRDLGTMLVQRAYAALGRPVLADIARVHHLHWQAAGVDDYR
jgi:hypothetical protein